MYGDESHNRAMYLYHRYSELRAALVQGTSLYVHELLDVMGYHDFVAEHMEVFKESQGTRMPPGTGRDDRENAVNYYDYHSGYLCAPGSVAVIDWMSDRGAILHTVCNHGHLTADQGFINFWLDSILKACEFIHDARAIIGHGGVEGLLPMGVDTDSQRQMQSIWADGWCYLGLTTTVRLLKRIDHPRAQEFAEEAEDYKEEIVRVLREHRRKVLYGTTARVKHITTFRAPLPAPCPISTR